MAGRSHAYGDDVLTARLEGECLVERQHPVDVALGNVQVPGNAADGLGGDVTELGLNLMEDVYELLLFGPEFIEHAVHDPSFACQWWSVRDPGPRVGSRNAPRLSS